METKLFNFNLPTDLKEYLEQVSQSNYTTISQYIINLIVDDKKLASKTRLIELMIEAKPLTEESLSTLTGTYTSGRKMNIGDTVLFGLLNIGEDSIKVVSFHPDEIYNLYSFSDKFRLKSKLPYLNKLK